MSGNNPRFPLFDSLRAIAALMVVACHLSVVLPAPLDAGWRPYLSNLNTGIAVFFLISGFLLYRPFVRARYEGRPAPGGLVYAQRRTLRIVPAYWIALVGVVLLLGPSGEAPGASAVFTLEGVVRYFGFLQIYDSDTLLGGISAAWTLCVEMTFYAFLPLWALLMGRLPWRSPQGFLRSELLGLALLFLIGVTWTAVAAATIKPTEATFLDITQVEPWLYLPPGFLDHFALGMLLAVLSVTSAGRRSMPAPIGLIERAPWLPWAVAAGAFVLLVNLPRLLSSKLVVATVGVHELQAVVALGLLVPAVFGDPNRGFVRRLLSNRALLWVGLVSYGLYLWHVAVNTKLIEWGVLDALGTVGFVAVALSGSLLAAAGSFYLIERHALRLSRRLSHRWRSQDADARMSDLARHERPEPGVP